MKRCQRRRLIKRRGIGLSMIAMTLALTGLMWILWTLLSRGFAVFAWDSFATTHPRLAVRRWSAQRQRRQQEFSWLSRGWR